MIIIAVVSLQVIVNMDLQSLIHILIKIHEDCTSHFSSEIMVHCRYTPSLYVVKTIK